MGLRMKNFNIMWIHWKIQFLGVHEKPIYRGNCIKKEDGGRGMFMIGGLIPNAHYAHLSFNLVVLWGHVQKQRQELFYKKAARKNFAIFTGKHLCRSLFLITHLSYTCYFIKRDSNSGFFLCITAFFEERLSLQVKLDILCDISTSTRSIATKHGNVVTLPWGAFIQKVT